VSFLRLVFQGCALKNKEMLELDEQDMRILCNAVGALKKRMNIRCGRPFFGILHNADKKLCNAGIDRLLVRYDGFILPCEAYKDQDDKVFVVGHIKDTALDEAMQKFEKHRLLNDLRDSITPVERCSAQLLGL